MKQKVVPQSRKNDIVVQDLNGEVLIYDLKANKAFCLNETSALVWQACDGTKSVSEISQAISKKLNEPANEDLVWLALDQLKEENLLENKEELVSNFNGMSRREAIRKVGLGTMIALPFVAGLVAPTAAMAGSCTATGSACDPTFTTTPPCCAGNCEPVSGGAHFCAGGPCVASGGACDPTMTTTGPCCSGTCTDSSGGGHFCP
jgi:hypothetical protein